MQLMREVIQACIVLKQNFDRLAHSDNLITKNKKTPQKFNELLRSLH